MACWLWYHGSTCHFISYSNGFFHHFLLSKVFSRAMTLSLIMCWKVICWEEWAQNNDCEIHCKYYSVSGLLEVINHCPVPWEHMTEILVTFCYSKRSADNTIWRCQAAISHKHRGTGVKPLESTQEDGDHKGHTLHFNYFNKQKW